MNRLPRLRGRDGRTARPFEWRAFTLIELLTVIAIIAILASIVIGVGRHASESGNVAKAKTELAVLSTALENYKRQFGDYPRTNVSAELLQALVGKAGPDMTPLVSSSRVLLDLAMFTTESAKNPLTDNQARLVDPWGNAYVYDYKMPPSGWTNSTFVLYSMGPDGKDDAALIAGGYPNRDSGLNLDNIYAAF